MLLRFPKEFSKNPLYRIPALAHHVPISTVRDNVYVLTDGSIAAVFRVKGMEYDLVSPRAHAEYTQALRSVLNTLPPKLQFKLLHRITHNYRDLLEEHEAELDGENEFARYVAWDQLRRYHQMMGRGELLRNENLIVLTYNPKVRWWEAANSLGALKDAVLGLTESSTVVQRTLREYALALQKYEDIIAPIVNQMQLAGLEPERLDDRALYALAWETLNPDLSLREPVPEIQKPDPRDPYAGLFSTGEALKKARENPELTIVAPVSEREQLCRSDWWIGDKWVRIGDTYYGAVYMRMLPMHVYPSLALQLAALPFEATLSFDALMLEKQKELEKRWATVRSDESKATTTLLGETPDPAKAELAQDKRQAYLELTAADQFPFAFRMVILIAAPDTATLNQRCQAVISLLRDMENAQGVREQYGIETLLKTTWPFALIDGNVATRKALTSHIASMLPLYSRWEGSRRPVTLFMDPLNRLVKHDPYPSNQLNRNKVTCGKSGSGKSFMTQVVDVQPHAAKANTEILIIESGGSFELTTRLFGGQNLRLGPSCPYNINPFDLPPGFDSMSEKDQEAELRYKYGFIKNLVMEMARIIDPEKQMVAENVIGTVTQRTYSRTKTPRLRDFYALLSEYKNPRDPAAEELAGALMTRLANYVVTPSGEEGIYARYFDTYTNFDSDSPIICFDLIDVKNDEALLRPLTMVTLLGLVYNRIMQRDGKERLVIVDEAWALIKPPKGGGESPAGQAISLFWREGRKLGASSNMISQNFSDMTADEVGKAVLGNSPIRHILVHQRIKANEDAFQDAGFSEIKRERIFNLHTRYGQYSEILVQEGDDEGVVRLPSSGIKYWLATTDPKDLRVRQQYWEKFHGQYGIDEKAVIALLAENFPGGLHAPHGKEMSDEEALLFADRWWEHYLRFAERVREGKRVPIDFI